VIAGELLSLLQPGHDGPVRFGDELDDLLVPIHNERQGGALHPSHGKEVIAHLAAGKRDEPGQDRSPGQVDDLPGLRGFGQPVVGVGQLLERALYLELGEGAEADPAHGAGRLLQKRNGLQSDELSFPVKVGGDYYLIALHGQFAQCVQDVQGGDPLGRVGLDQVHGVHFSPIIELRGIVQLDDVAAQAHHEELVPVPFKIEHLYSAHALALGATVGEDGGHARRGVGLLGDDQSLHQGASRVNI